MKPATTPAQSSSGLRRRLILGAGATSLGPLITLITQVVSVPTFLHFWGAEKYGEWLMIYAIPAYLAMSDMGFGTVAGSDMTMRVARGDFAGAITIFQSTWRLVTLISLALAAVLLPIIWCVPLGHVLRLSAIPLHEARLALLILVIDSLACLQTSLLISGFKAAGLNHVGVLGISIIRIVEGVCVLSALALGFGPIVIAATLLIVRALGNISLALSASARIPWLSFGFAHASWTSVRQLLRPAAAFMAFPASNAISLQGALLAIGIVLGPVYVAMFAFLRTVSRAAVQSTEIFKLSFWPELSAAYGAGNFLLARKTPSPCLPAIHSRQRRHRADAVRSRTNTPASLDSRQRHYRHPHLLSSTRRCHAYIALEHQLRRPHRRQPPHKHRNRAAIFGHCFARIRNHAHAFHGSRRLRNWPTSRRNLHGYCRRPRQQSPTRRPSR
jgi:hypothetical protein